MNTVLSDVEGKSIKAAKDCSAVESQLQDVQVSMAEHSQQHWIINGITTFLTIKYNTIYLSKTQQNALRKRKKNTCHISLILQYPRYRLLTFHAIIQTGILMVQFNCYLAGIDLHTSPTSKLFADIFTKFLISLHYFFLFFFVTSEQLSTPALATLRFVYLFSHVARSV